ncbi:GroES-like protein [Gloeophyllum trabeum ATCC 11539]|uniref:GroES-like protein n=1 Tax=Gloeophyllum trabeum (strain ATCC 11539 / FP-39264 / Madison 617) TaxID=670483 RepID=S7QIK1_GLOTA|nr:GroES-like protein [Gloeophyllum trabeum ATCC 11539]EPQ59087.1 GroES-like protein [Gloeophyllum trabeum ATCC 11539]
MAKFTPPKTYKAAAVTKKSALELIDVPWKDPAAGQVVVKVEACGVCRSDDLVVNQLMPAGLPRIPGHEIVGTVVAVGPGEKLWKEGQRVGGGWHGAHCFACRQCRKGDFNTCENEQVNGVTMDGGYAEYATLKSEAVVALPEGMDPAETAPLMCAGVTTYNSIRNMGLKAGDIVAVQGIGGLGHLALQYARAMGYKTVALSTSASKKALASELGAHAYLDASKVNQAEELGKMGGANLIVCTAPSADIIQALVPGLAVGGTLLVLAIAPDDLKFNATPFITKRLSLRGWPSGHAKDSEDCAAFSKLEGVKCRIQKYPLEKAAEAYQSMMDGSAKFRAVIVP